MVDTAGGDAKRWARARLGTVIKGKYRLDDVIGVGGMAVVFRATHRNQAEFAIKMLLPELSFRGDVKKRFLREGYAANSVKHPGVVQVVDDDITEEGAAFLVMELLQGASVEEVWAKHSNRLDVAAAVGIIDQLLDVLAAAHAKGIVHRDVKPANLFLLKSGMLKILDFGIARVKDAFASDAQGTHTGMLLGTPAFMAPEQAKGLTHEIDARTDVWAAGATFFTLVCGEPVHRGENSALMLINSATTPARAIGSVNAVVPAAIAAVVDRALAYDKTQRWADAEAMRDAMRDAARATLGAIPSHDALVRAIATDTGPALPAFTSQHTLALAPQPPRTTPARFVGGTTAQPVSTRDDLKPPTVSRLPLALGITLALLAGAGATLAIAIKLGHTPTQVTPEQTGTANVPAPSTPASIATPVNVVSAQPSAVAVESLPLVSHSVASRPQSVPSSPPMTSTPPVKPAPNCNPPFTIDSAGHKIFKKECF